MRSPTSHLRASEWTKDGALISGSHIVVFDRTNTMIDTVPREGQGDREKISGKRKIGAGD